MKKITFKNLLTLALCAFAFQVHAQVDFQSKTFYKLRTALASPDEYNTAVKDGEEKVPPFVDQFVYATIDPGKNALPLTPLNTDNPDLQLFAFVELVGQTVEYPAESGQMNQIYNIVSKFEGAGNGNGVLELNEIGIASSRTRIRGNAFPYDEDVAKFIVVEASQDDNESSYQLINAATIGAASQPNRAIQPDTNYEWLNFHTVDLGALDGARPRIEQFVFETETGEQVLSNEQFDVSSIFIANPVKNTLSVKGITDNVKQVTVYSVLGQQVLSRKVTAQSTLDVDVSGLTSGMYLVKLTGDNGSFTKKVIKE
ncbi:T9SS type A sorting domain-containing protein [uncultured Polaribacter sp.]|uniref:T9SS type A sorting domain-containing protein n=1 Tax=uncultured Polaribacter sp. TaxID=174711 RepID=UPI002639DDF2|nr:T9SS type A sorting domain-containing protein [uncultured Polaribacter sp.]